MLLKEKRLAVELLNKLCVNGDDFCFSVDERIAVSTQDVTEQGTPDIKITSPDKLIYIEVKHDSLLGYRQVERYKKALESSQKEIKQVILLTRFTVDFTHEEEKPYKHVHWFEVYNWLDAVKIDDEVVNYLAKSLKSFLEAKRMSMQKVSWEYINGVRTFNNLVDMIGEAIKAAKVPFYKHSIGWTYRGFLLVDKVYWCGIYFDDPLLVIFEMPEKEKFNPELLEKPGYQLKEDKYSRWFRLPLDEKHFFSLEKDEQFKLLTDFIRTVYAEAQQMRIKE